MYGVSGAFVFVIARIMYVASKGMTIWEACRNESHICWYTNVYLYTSTDGRGNLYVLSVWEEEEEEEEEDKAWNKQTPYAWVYI